jgi:monoamine oxidase
MARTPLLHTLQQLSRDFAEAEARKIPVEVVQEERRTRISRRTILKGAGALTAGAVLTDPLNWGLQSRLAQASSLPRIGIVGAGISGLSAALTLSDSGLPSTVYEASGYIGGRMHSNTTFWANNQVSEWCGELIDTDHTLIQSLAQRFKLPLVDVHQAEPHGSQVTYYALGHYYTQAQANQDFLPVYKILQEQVNAVSSPSYNDYTQTGYQLDHISAAEWIDRYVPGGHKSPFGRLIDAGYSSEYGLDTSVQSSLNIVTMLGGQTDPAPFIMWPNSDERYHIAGGNQRLPLAIADYLPKGSVKFHWRMQAVKKNRDGSITLTFKTPDGTQSETFDHVILTLPFTVLRHLDYSQAGFTKLKDRVIQELGMGTNTKLQLQFDSRYWHNRGAWPGITNGTIFTDTGFQNSWDVTRGQEGDTGIIVSLPGGAYGASYDPDGPWTTSDNAKVRHYASQFLKKLEEIWPGISKHYTGKATLSYPTGNPNLRGSYACYLVGQYTSLSGYEAVAQGNIHFAGEHCSTSYQGYMEGGAEEGARAAKEIITAIKK